MTQFEYLRIEPSLVRFIERFPQNSETMVAVLRPNGKLGIVAPFTSDINRIRRIFNHAEGMGTRERGDAYGKRVAEAAAGLDQGGGKSGGEADEIGANLSKQSEELTINQEAGRAILSMSALDALAELVSKLVLKDHVAIVYVAGGFGGVRMNTKMAGERGRMSSDLETMMDASNFLFMKAMNGSMEILSEVKKNVRRLNRNNVTIYSINTRGPYVPDISGQRPSSYDPETVHDFQDPMWQYANETGGLAFENSNNFDRGFENVLADVSHQYIICYSAPKRKKPGEYHTIKIVLLRPNVDLRHRLGYVD